MIERKFIAQRMKEYMIEEYISQNLKGAEHSKTKLQRTPLGEKVIIFSARPGIVVGRKGQNIKQLTKVLKKRFQLENPQVEISEVDRPALDANIMAEKIANYMERFGTNKFKGIGHRVMFEVMGAGAMGIEILISGKVPSSRAKTWRFYQGYLKKCGDIALTGVRTAYKSANLKTGIVGVKVSIMPPDTVLPDRIIILDEPHTLIEEVKEEGAVAEKQEAKETKKPATKKRAPRKKKAEPKKSAEPKEETPTPTEEADASTNEGA